ncbi:MAG: PAS domain S-box protein [Alphaproteobacteria bacterium]|nr:PAS domain S-box protein [Alphaproteobacteria bacterium]
MREQGLLLGFLNDPRLAPHALGDIPVWLWSADATRILWGNPAAAAIFNAPSSTALTGHTIDPKGSAALQIARLAGTLPHGATPRLELLRGFGGRLGGALMCGCSRITLTDRTPGILVVATEAPGRKLSVTEKAQRLLAGSEEPLALFAPDGSLLAASPRARAKLGVAESLAVFGAAALGATALAAGRAEGDHSAGRISIERIGADLSTGLLVAFAEPEAPTMPAEPPAVEKITAPIAPAPIAMVPKDAPIDTTPVMPPHRSEPRLVPPAASGRRQPLRFVWQMDDDGRFTIGSDEFKARIGRHTAAALGQPWSDIASTLGLDPEAQVARALASRDTWSGITVHFPIDGADTRLPVELSGLPVFDRDRTFRGYRGFGVCREAARVVEPAPIQPTTPSPAPRVEPPVFRENRPALTPVPPVNVVQFPSAPADDVPTLTPVERSAFSELANRLSARLRGRDKDKPDQSDDMAVPTAPRDLTPAKPQAPAAKSAEPKPERPAAPKPPVIDQRSILDRLPIGVLVYRLDRLIYANRSFLDWTGYEQLHALEEAGGLDALFVEPSGSEIGSNNGAQTLTIATNQGDQVPVEARLFTSPWDGESALVLMLTGVGGAGGDERQKTCETALRHAKAEVDEVRDILDASADGVVVLDADQNVQSINGGAAKLFGYESREVTGLPFTSLFAPESQREVLQSLDSAGSQSGARAGRDVIGRRRDGGAVPLFMTLSRVNDDGDKLCAIFRDMTFWKKTEGDLLNARRQAEAASAAKSDFLAKISHEIRTPLNAIIGFSEVMMQERFGPVGNERYRQYLKDIHTSGGHLVSLLNDLLDLSKIEAGKLELKFADVDLNELTQQSVALMQPQANRERIIIRTSLGSTLPSVTADARSVRQILLNLLSNSIKFTGAGGQVIVSTARGDEGEVVLRVRDTGIGMSEQDLAVALEPFRQLATSARWGSGGTGLGLPLTKALAEANRASFRISSAVDAGTLVEVAFPGSRLAAE